MTVYRYEKRNSRCLSWSSTQISFFLTLKSDAGCGRSGTKLCSSFIRVKNLTVFDHHALSSEPSQPSGNFLQRSLRLNKMDVIVCFTLWKDIVKDYKLIVKLLHDEGIYLWKSQSFLAADLFCSHPLSYVRPLSLCTGLSWHWQHSLQE